MEWWKKQASALGLSVLAVLCFINIISAVENKTNLLLSFMYTPENAVYAFVLTVPAFIIIGAVVHILHPKD